MTRRFISVVLLAGTLSACGQKVDAAQAVTDRPPYLSLCVAANGEKILFESRLKHGQLSSSFYRVGPGIQLQKLAFFDDIQLANGPRTPDDPTEADHEMAQWGANMAGTEIVNGYQITTPMKTIQFGGQKAQQMVGQARLQMRIGANKWEASCDQIGPRDPSYAAFLKEAG